MTVTTHIAEILRQGIWASLTGGWYYEPSHSIFCNTVHLYTWLALLIIPLVVGLITAGEPSLLFLIGYTSFIGFVFMILKALVLYLHMIFDTSEPIITTKATTDVDTDQFSRVEHVSPEDAGIEMREIRRIVDRRSETRSRLMESSSRHSSSRRRVRIEFEPRDENAQPLDVSDVEMEFREHGTVAGREVTEEQRAKIEKALEALNEKYDTPRDEFTLPATDSDSKVVEIAESEDQSSSLSKEEPSLVTQPKMFRKMSEPTFPGDPDSWNQHGSDRRRSCDTVTRVRRANSTFESGNRETKGVGVLSEASLVQARQNTHKSYPSKISSDDEFHSRKLTKKQNLAGSSTSDNAHQSEMSGIEINTDAEVAQYTSEWKDSSPRVFGPQEGARASSREPIRPQPVLRAGTPIDPKISQQKHLEYDPADIPSTSSAGWVPVIVSLNDSDRPSSSSITRLDERPGPSDSSTNIKGEITKFLEDLIDKHPETLDAIESVRMSRLGRAAKISSTSRNTGRRSSSSTVSALSDLAVRDGTHVAAGHEDTTQGAVHSFQDEDGNWWTYSFDEQGVGTAQPLGSASTLLEMIQRERSTGPVNNRTLLDVLPESTYASSEEEVEQHPSTSQGPVVQTTRRERALSSSSNESYTYIPSVPTSIFHAGSGTGASRGSRNQMVSFVNVASRLRSAVRQPMEERQRQGELDQIIDLLDRRAPGTDRRRSTSSLQGRMMDFQERMFHMDTGSVSSSNRRLFQEMGAAYRPAGMSEFGSAASRRAPAVKKSYYYQMKMFPKTNKSLKLKMDRLAVSALFDRNRGIASCVFDTVLACCVATLAGMVMATGIYYDLSLFFFAFVVAGAHFSLLKSVQPDAASPIHGFNWLVAYSRPVYFCILCSILLTLNHFCDDPQNTKIPWNWNPYRYNDATSEMVLLACRDFVAFLIVFLPVCFTFGWLPQVNTLTHHVFEQLEMHVFGGTASISVTSATFQLLKSVGVWAVLVALCRVANFTNSNTTQAPAFSAFLAISLGLSYILSRFSSNPQLAVILGQCVLDAVRGLIRPCRGNSRDEEDVEEEGEILMDALPERLKMTIGLRARHDLLFATVLILAAFGFHSTSVFSATRPYFIQVIVPLCVLVSVFNHYIYMQLRSHTPWKLLAKPVLRSGEFNLFECSKEAHLMGFERLHVWLQTMEKNLLLPLLVMCQLSDAAWSLPAATFLSPLIALRLFRGGFSHPQMLYVPLVLSFIATRFDWSHHLPFGLTVQLPQPALFVLCYYLMAVFYPKWLELYLKINFIMAYVAPWQISWGSAFHAFAQPFSVPHSALIWAQTIVSSVLSAPLNPFLGSSFFMTSYVRPVKFWERDYNTKRCDASNTRLASQIDRGPMLDDSNLNAVFYEHLTRSLQTSLAGDLLMGRWATSVQPGDCFILASFYLNCLVHIVEVGNGFVTFQLRGLEFRGTYCHQREVEAISEDQTEGAGFCCCSPGSLPGFLSLNTAWSLRWLAWEVVAAKYVIDGYSITDNSAVNLLQVHELRRLLVTLYVKCIIYYASTSTKLMAWMNNETIKHALLPIVENDRYSDVDHMFGPTNDEDYDNGVGGISKASFSAWYSPWIMYCISMRKDTNQEEPLNNDHFFCLCYLLSLLGRRALGTASHNRHSTAAESFLYGLHALFKGDFRIQCQRDEWVFADMDLLRLVISPAVKMALKLHQDHFAAVDDFDDVDSLYKVISEHQTKLFISHEQDPAWRRAILSNTSSLLALRHMYDDGQDDYKIIMLNKMHLNMRVIKLNRECVRAFWAGQQQELIYLRNRNPERGSIQNARQVLRNMINSSADQPVGYPIYVSPLTTSFVDTHSQIKRIVGPTITLEAIGNGIRRTWRSLRKHLGPSTSSNQGGCAPPSGLPSVRDQEDRTSQASREGHGEQSIVQMTADGTARVTLARRPHSETPSIGKKSSTAAETPPATVIKRVSTEGPPPQEEDAKSNDTDRDLFATQLDEQGKPIWLEINDLEQIFKYLNEPLKSTGQPLVEWPSEDMRQMASYKSWFCQPTVSMPGRVIHTWYPNHPSKKLRSHIGDVIYLLSVPEMANALIAIAERGCRRLSEKEVKRIRARIDPPDCGEGESCIDRPRPRIRRVRQPPTTPTVPLSDVPSCSTSQH